MPDPVVNFGKVGVSTGYDAAAASVTLTTGDGARLPQPSTDGAFDLVWWNSTDYPDAADDPNREIVRVTARSGDVLTVARGQQGITASTKNTAGKAYKMQLGWTRDLFTQLAGKRESVSSTTPTLTFEDAPKVVTLTTSGNTTFTLAGMAVGRRMTLVITADALRTLAWAQTLTWLETPSTGPTTIASGKVMEVSFECDGTSAASVRAVYAVQP